MLLFNVPLKEIIRADQSCWLYFDIEIKTADLAAAGHVSRWTNIMKEHSKLLKDMRGAMPMKIENDDVARGVEK